LTGPAEAGLHVGVEGNGKPLLPPPRRVKKPTSRGEADYYHFKQSGFDRLHRMKCIPECFTTPSRVTLPWLVLAIGSALMADPRAGAAPEQAFAGRWDLTISDSSNKQLPSWLELTGADGVWKTNFVGRWGNARPLPKVAIKGNLIQFISPKEEEDSKTDLAFDGKLAAGTLTGVAQGPDGTAWT
jgi:hypothetical protein